MNVPQPPMTLAEAIARMEGFYRPGTRPNRNNNPGDIEYGKFAIAHGATGIDGRFAIFPTPEAGLAALTALLETGSYKGATLTSAIHRYAPPDENDTQRYINMVSQWTGIQPDALIA